MISQKRGIKAPLGVWGVLILLATTAVLVAAIGPFPEFLLERRGKDWEKLAAFQQYRLEATMRSHILQALGGFLVLVGAITAIRQLSLARQIAFDERESKHVEAFAVAVGLLGQANGSSQISGVHALWRIGNIDCDQRVSIIEVLSSFVRRSRGSESQEPCELAVRALVDLRSPGSKLDLSGAQCLRGASLSALDLAKVNFDRCDLREANLSGSILAESSFLNADLSRSNLSESDLAGVKMGGTKLLECNVKDARSLPEGFAR